LYSKRLSWPVSVNAYSQRISQLRSDGIPLLDLSSSNPTAVDFNYPHREIADALSNAGDLGYNPDPLGEAKAREAVQMYYSRRGLAVEADRILLTASTSEAYGDLFKLLCDPGDEVLVPRPSYPLFEYLAALESVRMVPYWLRYDGSWHVDFGDLRQRISPRTRAIVIVNPNNPTGSFLKEREAVRLVALAAERGLPVIADEVFFDYPLGRKSRQAATLVNRHDVLSFSLNGLSKAAGMPQMKLGWIVLNGPDAKRERARQRLELILDTYLSVNTPVQRALPALLGLGESMQARILSRTRENLRVLEDLLRDSAAHPLCTEGGWSAIVRLPDMQDEEKWLLDLLEQEQVIAQPGYFFDLECGRSLVVSLITPPESFREGISRMKKLVDRVAR
jgi:aspartate/methionine/tyrosine aminotransferase